MIDNVEFKNFKSFEDVTLEGLGRLAVFVGPNGSGKTSILEGIDYLARLGRTKPSELFVKQRDPRILLRRGASERQFEIATEGSVVEQRVGLRLEVEVATDDEKDRGTPDVFRFSAQVDGREFREPVDYSLTYEPRTRELGFDVSSALLLRLDPEKLAAPSYSDEETPKVKHDGEGLATVLREMQTSRPKEFERVVESLSRVVPLVEGIRTRRATVYMQKTQSHKQFKVETVGDFFARNNGSSEPEKYMGEELVFDMKGAPDVPAHAVSEGTLLCLGLITVIKDEPAPKLLLLDDLERALHPKALGDLIEVLRGLLEEFPELQILATSHSPYLLDHLEADEIWLTTVDEDGNTAADRLQAHPEFEMWKDEMSPGEFWSYVGEDWLLEPKE